MANSLVLALYGWTLAVPGQASNTTHGRMTSTMFTALEDSLGSKLVTTVTFARGDRKAKNGRAQRRIGTRCLVYPRSFLRRGSLTSPAFAGRAHLDCPALLLA